MKPLIYLNIFYLYFYINHASVFNVDSHVSNDLPLHIWKGNYKNVESAKQHYIVSKTH